VFILGYIVVAIAAYLLGSIPTGFLVGRVRGVDIRAVGSGNIGAANTFRAIGKTAGIFVLLIDALKGFLAVEVCGSILKCFGTAEMDVEIHYRILAGIFAVLGHNYTCWLKFKGGKGVATMAGVYLALAPAAVGIAAGAFILAVAIWRYTSVGSMLAAVVLTIAVWFIEPPDMILRTVTIALSVLTLLKHRTNIQRLIAGKENRIEFRKKPPLS
jgi:glycerol-3-phosphate acyltransferase PlsY